MTVLRDRPRGCGVALDAACPKKAAMAVIIGMAGDATERGFLRGRCRVARRKNGAAPLPADPSDHRVARGGVAGVRRASGRRLPQAQSRQGRVVHPSGPEAGALVFDVALNTTLHVGMEGRWLTLKQRLIVRVAHDAARSLDPFRRRVTGRAVVGQEGVG